MRDELQALIYSEKLLAYLYQRAAALSALESERKTFLDLSQRAAQNVALLNYFYRQEYGVGYDPIIPEANIPTTYRGLLMEIESQEITSLLDYANRSHGQSSNVNTAMRQISDDKVAKVLAIQAILIAMNGTQTDNMMNQNTNNKTV